MSFPSYIIRSSHSKSFFIFALRPSPNSISITSLGQVHGRLPQIGHDFGGHIQGHFPQTGQTFGGFLHSHGHLPHFGHFGCLSHSQGYFPQIGQTGFGLSHSSS